MLLYLFFVLVLFSELSKSSPTDSQVNQDHVSEDNPRSLRSSSNDIFYDAMSVEDGHQTTPDNDEQTSARAQTPPIEQYAAEQDPKPKTEPQAQFTIGLKPPPVQFYSRKKSNNVRRNPRKFTMTMQPRRDKSHETIEQKRELEGEVARKFRKKAKFNEEVEDLAILMGMLNKQKFSEPGNPVELPDYLGSIHTWEYRGKHFKGYYAAWNYVRKFKEDLEHSCKVRNINVKLHPIPEKSYVHPTGGYEIVSPFYGVFFKDSTLTWEVVVWFNNNKLPCGEYNEILEAAYAYNQVIEVMNKMGLLADSRPLNKVHITSTASLGHVHEMTRRIIDEILSQT